MGVKEIGVKLTEYVKVLITGLKLAQSINTILSEELNEIVNEHCSTENLHTSEKLISQTKTT
jgi:hypothetical protein